MRNCHFLRPDFRAIVLGLLGFATAANAQNSLTNLAGEFSVTGALVGDQVASHVALGANGGYVVWQDNATDGDGAGVSARRLNSNLSGDLTPFRVNEVGVGEQENPQVALLNNGGAVFVWQGGSAGLQEIYLRILDASGVFQTGDILVNVHTAQQQSTPSVACLSNGNIIVVWSSFGQDGSLQGVYGRVFSSVGVPVSGEFQVNQTTALNQRNPRVAALSSGEAVVVWASERTGSVSGLQYVVDICGRIITAEGAVVDGQFGISTAETVNSQPSVTAHPAGGYVVVWGQLDVANSRNGSDIYARAFSADNQPVDSPALINTYLVGDQFAPKLAVSGADVLAAWTSLAQDGAYEGVFGRRLSLAGQPQGAEFRVNTTTASKQMHPSVAADASGRFLVVWSSFIGGNSSFDLFGQRYVVGGAGSQLIAPDMPSVSAIDSSSLSVTWPELSGFPVDFYELYIDGQATPIVTTNLYVTVANLLPASTHTFQLRYQLIDGRRSPLSALASGTTWGGDSNGDGLPDDWQVAMWGPNIAAWPSASADSDGDGASNYNEFLAGTDPNDASSVLKTRLHRTQQGLQFAWDTRPQSVYQVQIATELGNWQNLGAPRYARGSVDAVNVAAAAGSVFYRVIRLR